MRWHRPHPNCEWCNETIGSKRYKHASGIFMHRKCIEQSESMFEMIWSVNKPWSANKNYGIFHHLQFGNIILKHVKIRGLHQCWKWIGSFNENKMPKTLYKTNPSYYMYTMFIGDAYQRELQPACGDYACCNPWHWRPLERGRQTRKPSLTDAEAMLIFQKANRYGYPDMERKQIRAMVNILSYRYKVTYDIIMKLLERNNYKHLIAPWEKREIA